MKVTEPPFIADSAIIQSLPGTGTKVWHYAHIREDAVVGEDCVIGNCSYIDRSVKIGNKVKVGNGAQVFFPAVVEDEVFIGPNAMLINDRYPRSTTPEGRIKREGDWESYGVKVCRRASIGAGAVVLPGVTIGEEAMIGAGSVVTKDVPAGGTWMNNALVQKETSSEYVLDVQCTNCEDEAARWPSLQHTTKPEGP